MKYEYRVTFDDFKRSVRAWRRLSLWRRVVWLIQLWIAPPVLLAFSAIMLVIALQEPNDPTPYYSLSGICGALAILEVVLPLVRLRHAYKQRVVMTKGQPIFVELLDDGIRFTVPDGANLVYKWSAFTWLHEDDKTVTLFVTKAVFHTIPKSAMPEECWERVRTSIKRDTK
jgi:hypothetical protein